MANEAVIAEVERLRSEGTVADEDIIKQILTANPNTKAGDIADALGVKPFDVGRIRSQINRSNKPPTQKASPGGGEAVPGKGGSQWQEWLDSLPPQASRLYDSLLQVYARKPQEARSLVNIFVKNARILQTRQAFHNWLTRYLIPQDALSRIEDEMFGLDYLGNSGDGMMGGFGGGMAGNQPQIQYMPQPGGGVMPVIIMPQGGGASPYPGFMPSWDKPKSHHDDEGDEHESKAVAELSKKVDQLADALLVISNQSSNPPAEPAPKFRKVVLRGEDGQPLLDGDGHAMYDEVPYEEGGVLTASSIRDIVRAESRAQEKHLSAEEVTNIVNKAMDDRQNRVSKEDIRQMIEEATAKKEPASDPKLATLEATIEQMKNERRLSDETAKAVSAALAPIQERMAAMEKNNNYSSLTGDAARYAHQETLANMWHSALDKAGVSLDSGMRMLLINSQVAQMKTMGLPDDIIQEFVKSAMSGNQTALPSGAGTLKEAAGDFARKYLTPGK